MGVNTEPAPLDLDAIQRRGWRHDRMLLMRLDEFESLRAELETARAELEWLRLRVDEEWNGE